MAISTINSSDNGANSLTKINDNFTELNDNLADLDTAKADIASPAFTGTVTLPTGLTGVLRADSGVVSVDTASALSFDISTSSTPSFDTTAGQRLTIIAKGTYSTSGHVDTNVTVNMKINAVTVDTCILDIESSSAGTAAGTVSFIYSAIPGAQTNAITFDQTITNIQVLAVIG